MSKGSVPPEGAQQLLIPKGRYKEAMHGGRAGPLGPERRLVPEILLRPSGGRSANKRDGAVAAFYVPGTLGTRRPKV